MVFVNIIASLLLLAGVLFYKFVYPKKKINLFVLLILISILPIISIFRLGTYESGDFNIHIRRSMEFYKLLTEGNLIPSWAGDLNGTYGYPLFAFDYILPYYLISFLHILTFSFIASLKIFLALNFIFSGIFMYIFSKNYFKKELVAFATAILYLFTPYHLIAIHFKITIGEILAYTLIPLVFYFLNKFLQKGEKFYIVISGLILGLIFLSHVFIAFCLTPIIILYLLITAKNVKNGLLNSLLLIFISQTISCYQWLSSFVYHAYLFTTAYPNNITNLYFPTIRDLLYSPWRLGLLFQGPRGELSFLIGYAQILILTYLAYLIIKNKIQKDQKKLIIFWVVLFILTIFFITPYSKPIWKYLPLLNNAGSQRLLIIVGFYTSLLAGYLFSNIKKNSWIIYALIFIAIITSILNWGQRRVIPNINDNTLRENLSLGTQWGDTHFYANSRWVNPINPWFSKIPTNHLDILSGNGSVISRLRSSTKHTYIINAKTPLLIRENTLYFPGWQAFANGDSIKINPDKNGVIEFRVNKGRQKIILIYKDLSLLTLSKQVSLISFVLIFIYIIYFYRVKLTTLISKVLDKD